MDRDCALAAIDWCKANLQRVESVLVDGGHTDQSFADGVMAWIEATICVRGAVQALDRRTAQRLAGKMPPPWKNCERKLNTSLQMIHLAFLRLLLKRS